jgi:hypothetical protein
VCSPEGIGVGADGHDSGVPCVFCRKDATLTAEHVLPQWIRPHVSDPGGRGTHTRTEIRVGEWVDERSFAAKPAALKVRSVCAACNNGWMSDLEDEAKPFLLSMINGHRRTYYRRGQCLIAMWLLKTALVAGSKFEPALPSDFYERLYAERQRATTRVCGSPARRTASITSRTSGRSAYIPTISRRRTNPTRSAR